MCIYLRGIHVYHIQYEDINSNRTKHESHEADENNRTKTSDGESYKGDSHDKESEK